MGYEEVVRTLTLRPLDRLDTLACAGAISGPNGVSRNYLQAGEEEWAEGDEYDEGAEEETDESDSEEDEDFLQFEDKEYEEAEAIYVQACNDVRRDLRSRRKERGFVKHGRKSNGGSPKRAVAKDAKVIAEDPQRSRRRRSTSAALRVSSWPGRGASLARSWDTSAETVPSKPLLRHRVPRRRLWQ